MTYWGRLVVGLGFIVASTTMFVYALVELVTHIHGSCGSGTDTDTGVTLSPCPHNTAFWIVALVVSVFLFIAGIVGYVGRGSPPPRRTADADTTSGGLAGLGSMSMAPVAAPAAPTPAAVAAGDLTDQLQQLQQLKDGGLLDEDEFKKAKAKILGGRS
jgi:hypothetical protein